MNIVRNAFAAQIDGYNQGEKVRMDGARIQAGRQMERGGPEAAAGILYGAGDLQGGAAMQQMQQQGQERQQQLQQAEAARKLDYMKRLGVAVGDIPAPVGADGREDTTERRRVYLEKIAPALVELGMKQEDALAAADHLDSAAVRTFVGDIDKQIQVINLGGGGVASYNKQTGDFKTLREPTQKAPAGFMYGPDGGLMVDPGYVAGQGQISDARAGATARHRAPRVGRSGGGAAAASGLPAGFILD